MFRRKYWKVPNFYSSNKKQVRRIDKIEEEITRKCICYILNFTDSPRFLVSSLSNLVNNLSEGINRTKCKLRHDDEKCKTYTSKYKYCDCFLDYRNFKDDLIEHKSLCCNKKLSTQVWRKVKATIL